MSDQPLPDIIRPNLKVLFVGFNPSIYSGQTGHHFASPNNRFYKILYESGLTPYKYKPVEDAGFLELGYGLTNLVSRPTRSAAEISSAEYSVGRELLLQKIKLYRPRIVCLVGKGVYQMYARKKEAAWGFQDNALISGITDFVAPSSSGLVRMRMEQIVAIYKTLNDFLRNSQPII